METITTTCNIRNLERKLAHAGLAGVVRAWPTVAVYNTKDGGLDNITFLEHEHVSEATYVTADGIAVPSDAVCLLDWTDWTFLPDLSSIPRCGSHGFYPYI